MKAILDTCIVIDLLQKREPFFKDAYAVFLAVAENRFEGYLSANAVTDIYYLMHRYLHNNEKTEEALNKLFKLVNVIDTAGIDCRKALLSQVKDFEDAVLVETAKREKADCIVTRNIKDFKNSSVKVYSPGEFLKLLNNV